MSGRYSDRGGDHRQGNGDYRGGGYHGHRNGGGFPYGKINEDDVPESQHSIFVRGLPSSITYDEIKNFFEDNIGPCSFDFQKVNYERQSLFVAMRFDTKEHAKEAYNRYRDEDILGCRCEVSWFRDIRRYISYQQQTGGVIRRGSFGRGQQANRYNNYNNRPDYRKRRYSDDRRSRSRSYSDSDRSRSSRRSRRSSRDRSSRSRSRSEGERSTSRESDRRRSESKDEKRKEKKKEKKVKKASKKERRGRRSESGSSRSEGERSRSSSRSDRDDERDGKNRKRSKTDRRDRDASPASSTGSPLRMTPPPVPPTIIGPVIPSAAPSTTATPTPMEKSAPLRITIANKATVPVENTSFKMALDTDEPPRKIVRGPLTPEKKVEDDAMEVEEKEEEEVPLRKETPVVHSKEKGGWRTVGDDNSGPPSDVTVEAPAPVASLPPPPPAPTLVQPTLAKVNGTPEKTAANGIEMIPRSVGGPPPPHPSMGTPTGPPPKRPPMGTPSSLPPPPGRPSMGAGGVSGVTGALAAKCPEMAKTIGVIKTIQDQLITSVRPNNRLSLSDLSSGESMLEKMEERERLIKELDPVIKNKFDMKMKQIANSYRGDAQTITTVVKSLVQKDPTLEDQIKPALLAVLEDVEKQIYKKVDDFLVCGI